MKNNTENTRNLLEAALASCPDDCSLNVARNFIRAALQQVHHVEGKRGRRHLAEQQQTLKQYPYLAPRYDLTAKECRQAVMRLDRMIAQEEAKIAPVPDADGTQNIQTILG